MGAASSSASGDAEVKDKLEQLRSRVVPLDDAEFWDEFFDLELEADGWMQTLSFEACRSIKALSDSHSSDTDTSSSSCSNIKAMALLALSHVSRYMEAKYEGPSLAVLLNSVRVLTRLVPLMLADPALEDWCWQKRSLEHLLLYLPQKEVTASQLEGGEGGSFSSAADPTASLSSSSAEQQGAAAGTESGVFPVCFASILLHATTNLLFFPGFAVDDEVVDHDDAYTPVPAAAYGINDPAFIWRGGVAIEPESTIEVTHLDHQRLEVLHLYIVTLSLPLYKRPQPNPSQQQQQRTTNRWTALAVSHFLPFSNELCFSLLNTVLSLGAPDSVWTKVLPFLGRAAGSSGGSEGRDLQERLGVACLQLLTILLAEGLPMDALLPQAGFHDEAGPYITPDKAEALYDCPDYNVYRQCLWAVRGEGELGKVLDGLCSILQRCTGDGSGWGGLRRGRGRRRGGGGLRGRGETEGEDSFLRDEGVRRSIGGGGQGEGEGERRLNCLQEALLLLDALVVDNPAVVSVLCGALGRGEYSSDGGEEEEEEEEEEGEEGEGEGGGGFEGDEEAGVVAAVTGEKGARKGGAVGLRRIGRRGRKGYSGVGGDTDEEDSEDGEEDEEERRTEEDEEGQEEEEEEEEQAVADDSVSAARVSSLVSALAWSMDKCTDTLLRGEDTRRRRAGREQRRLLRRRQRRDSRQQQQQQQQQVSGLERSGHTAAPSLSSSSSAVAGGAVATATVRESLGEEGEQGTGKGSHFFGATGASLPLAVDDILQTAASDLNWQESDEDYDSERTYYSSESDESNLDADGGEGGDGSGRRRRRRRRGSSIDSMEEECGASSEDVGMLQLCVDLVGRLTADPTFTRAISEVDAGGFEDDDLEDGEFRVGTLLGGEEQGREGEGRGSYADLLLQLCVDILLSRGESLEFLLPAACSIIRNVCMWSTDLSRASSHGLLHALDEVTSSEAFLLKQEPDLQMGTLLLEGIGTALATDLAANSHLVLAVLQHHKLLTRLRHFDLHSSSLPPPPSGVGDTAGEASQVSVFPPRPPLPPGASATAVSPTAVGVAGGEGGGDGPWVSIQLPGNTSSGTSGGGVSGFSFSQSWPLTRVIAPFLDEAAQRWLSGANLRVLHLGIDAQEEEALLDAVESDVTVYAAMADVRSELWDAQVPLLFRHHSRSSTATNGGDSAGSDDGGEGGGGVGGEEGQGGEASGQSAGATDAVATAVQTPGIAGQTPLSTGPTLSADSLPRPSLSPLRHQPPHQRQEVVAVAVPQTGAGVGRGSSAGHAGAVTDAGERKIELCSVTHSREWMLQHLWSVIFVSVHEQHDELLLNPQDVQLFSVLIEEEEEDEEDERGEGKADYSSIVGP